MTFVNVMFSTFEHDRIADLFDVICLNRYYGWYVDSGDLRPPSASSRPSCSAGRRSSPGRSS